MAQGTAVRLSHVSFSWRRGGPPDLTLPALSLAEGDLAVITGPSGSGKTSLLNLVSGISVPETGELEVLGQNMLALSASARDAFRADNIGLIFQTFNLLPYLSVIDNIRLAATFSKARRHRAGDVTAQARALLDDLDLPADTYADRAVRTLSIGQQQRVAAARALTGNPRLLIADEPTSSLDAVNRDRFVDLVMRVCRKNGTTLLVVSHDDSITRHFDTKIHLPDLNQALPVAGGQA